MTLQEIQYFALQTKRGIFHMFVSAVELVFMGRPGWGAYSFPAIPILILLLIVISYPLTTKKIRIRTRTAKRQKGRIFAFCPGPFCPSLPAMTPTLALVVLVLFAGASFFFALAETSLFSLGKWQLRQLEERSPTRGKIISRLLSEPQDLLATLALGNSFANAGIVAIGLLLAMRRAWAAPAVWPALLVLILFGGEVAPKALAVRAPELWATRVAGVMFFLQRVSRPLRRVARRLTNLSHVAFPSPPALSNALSDAEYQALVEMAYQQGALAAAEKEIILQII